jgi:hypothetical protein
MHQTIKQATEISRLASTMHKTVAFISKPDTQTPNNQTTNKRPPRTERGPQPTICGAQTQTQSPQRRRNCESLGELRAIAISQQAESKSFVSKKIPNKKQLASPLFLVTRQATHT